jgi:hypothetical protein
MDANTNPETRFAVRNIVNQIWSDLTREPALAYLLAEEQAEPVLEQNGAIRVMPVI